jgi:Zn-dependent protease
VFFVEPPRSPWDINVILFRIPVRITPYFWIFGLFLFGINSPTPGALLAAMVALLLSILIHELGHAAAFRSYGHYPVITLYAMGGLTSPGPRAFGIRNAGFAGRVFITAAGPGAQLLAAALVYQGFKLAGYHVGCQWGLPHVVSLGVDLFRVNATFNSFVNAFLFFSVFWAILNLLPVFPLDGGQIAREVLLQMNPREGLRQSLVLSVLVAGLVAVAALVQWRDWFMAALFAFLAYSNYVQLASDRRGRW